MIYELDEESAAKIKAALAECHGAMTDLLKRSLKSATGRDEIAAIESEIANADRMRDEVLATLDKRKGAR